MPDNNDQTMTNPQAMVDAALGTPEVKTTPAEPKTELPTLTPLTSPAPEPVVTIDAPTISMTPPAFAPAEEKVVEPVMPAPAPIPTPMPEPTPAPSSTPMGDDTPLSFAMPAPSSTPTTDPLATNPIITTTPPPAAPLPPIAPAAIPVAPTSKPKGKNVGMILGAFLLFGIVLSGGLYYYKQATAEPQVAVVSVRGNEKECKGCRNGYQLRWSDKNGCVQGDKCKLDNVGSDAQCKESGGIWCDSVDSKGKAYKFCIDSSVNKGCNAMAVEKGYTIQTGNLKCVESGGSWVADPSVTYLKTANTDGKADADAACKLQGDKNKTVGFGSGSYICKEGQKGVGGVVYSGGTCTELNGKKFTGNLGCFCGTVQVDTTNGHTSYQSTCGCDKTTEETKPSMACTGLTYTPVAAPKVDDKLTFTCAGSITPASAGTLSYKFRYSVNAAAPVALANKTATTAELTIAACGTYSVECQTCATIAGVLTCDPTWTGATQ